MARTYIISEICGDWALQIREPGHPHQFLYFNSENNADLVKSILEWEDEHPNEAVPYKPTLTPPNEWVSVEERLPIKSGEYLAYTTDENIGFIEFDEDCGEFGFSKEYYQNGAYLESEWTKADWITHWMPLSAPPDHRLPEGEDT